MKWWKPWMTYAAITLVVLIIIALVYQSMNAKPKNNKPAVDSKPKETAQNALDDPAGVVTPEVTDTSNPDILDINQ